MKNPRIAIVQDWLTTFRGGEQVLLAIHELYPEAPIFTSIYNPEKVPQFAKADVRTSFLQKIPGAKKRFEVLIPLMPQAFESFDMKGFDVIISVGNGLSKGVLSQPGQKHIWYCHTPPRYLWSLGGDARNKGKLDSGLREYVSHKLRIWDVISSARPDVIIANSKTTASRIAKIYRREAQIVHPGVRTDVYLPTKEAVGDFFLTVGQMVSYKRTDLLVQACAELNVKLKVVGEGPEFDRVKAIAKGNPCIEFLGRLSNDDLKPLYATAKAFLFAAEEDFGIVPVEAMSAGRPVIAYGKGGATETVIPGKTGELFAEQTVESLKKALQQFDPTAYNPDTIREHALTFSIQRFKERITAIVDSL